VKTKMTNSGNATYLCRVDIVVSNNMA